MKKLDTLEQMVSKSLSEQPEQAVETLEEYFENLGESDPKQLITLKAKLNDPNTGEEYSLNFKKSLLQTSLILFILTLETFTKHIILEESQNFNISAYLKEFLFFTRNDDSLIFNMRVLYLTEANGKSIIEEIDALNVTNNIEKSDSENNLEIEKYDHLRLDILNQYLERNAHLA